MLERCFEISRRILASDADTIAMMSAFIQGNCYLDIISEDQLAMINPFPELGMSRSEFGLVKAIVHLTKLGYNGHEMFFDPRVDAEGHRSVLNFISDHLKMSGVDVKEIVIRIITRASPYWMFHMFSSKLAFKVWIRTILRMHTTGFMANCDMLSFPKSVLTDGEFPPLFNNEVFAKNMILALETRKVPYSSRPLFDKMIQFFNNRDFISVGVTGYKIVSMERPEGGTPVTTRQYRNKSVIIYLTGHPATPFSPFSRLIKLLERDNESDHGFKEINGELCVGVIPARRNSRYEILHESEFRDAIRTALSAAHIIERDVMAITFPRYIVFACRKIASAGGIMSSVRYYGRSFDVHLTASDFRSVDIGTGELLRRSNAPMVPVCTIDDEDDSPPVVQGDYMLAGVPEILEDSSRPESSYFFMQRYD